MRTSPLVLLALALPAPFSVAQKTCAAANVTATPRGLATPVNAWFALPFNVPSPTTITACDFRLSTSTRNKQDGAAMVAIWDNANGTPNRILGRASITVTRNVIGFYGAKFAAPIQVQPGTYWVALRNTGGIVVALGGTRTPYFWGPPVFQNWIGPVRTAAWAYRVYCGTHGGGYVEYGSGKNGSGAVAPRIRGLGQPNTSNLVQIQLNSGLGGAAAFFLWGVRVAVAIPYGTLYATPVVLLPVKLAGQTPGNGHATLQFTLPLDARLKGLRIAMQGWVLDPAAAGGLAHTQGLEMTVGH